MVALCPDAVCDCVWGLCTASVDSRVHCDSPVLCLLAHADRASQPTLAPLTVTISPQRDDEGQRWAIRDLLQRFNDFKEQNRASIRNDVPQEEDVSPSSASRSASKGRKRGRSGGARDGLLGKDEKRQWWKRREEVDSMLKDVIRDMQVRESVWKFGCAVRVVHQD